MKAVGVVCEYNPFHLGHEYHLSAVRRDFGQETVIVCVMSGDFVQRGEGAIFDKFSRARAACLNGANLVVELPLPWCISSAEGYSRAALFILGSLGIDVLSFGSESGNSESLEIIARCLTSPGFNEKLKTLLSTEPNMSYAAAREKLLKAELGETARLIETPNNILAVEYLRAIKELGYEIAPHTIKRFGSGHDSTGVSGPKSASDIRSMYRSGISISDYVPEKAMEVCAEQISMGKVSDAERMECAVMSRLRALKKTDFESLPDGGDGAGARLYEAVRVSNSMDEIIENAKTKRYAASRLRRMLMYAALDVDAGTIKAMPPYARVLAADSRGTEYLSLAKKRAQIPILTKGAAVKELSAYAQSVFELGASAHDLYTLSYASKDNRCCGEDWRSTPFILR